MLKKDSEEFKNVINEKEKLLLMFLSCFLDYVPKYQFERLIRVFTLKKILPIEITEITDSDISNILKSKLIDKNRDDYIIKDAIIREMYFSDFFSNYNELFNEFTGLIIHQSYNNQDYSLSILRIFFYNKQDDYYPKMVSSEFINYLNFIVDESLNKNLELTSNTKVFLNSFSCILWYKLMKFEDISYILLILKSLPEYYELFLGDFHYNTVLGYNYLMQGDLNELEDFINKTYTKDSIWYNIFDAIIKLLKGDYQHSMIMFRDVFKIVRNKEEFKESFFFKNIHSLFYLLSITKYPKYYSSMHNAYYQNIKYSQKSIWRKNLYSSYIKNENIRDVELIVLNDYHSGIETIVEIISYSWLNITENWDVKKLEYVAQILLKNGYDWLLLELSFILKESIHKDNNWSKIYIQLKEKMPEIISISSIMEFKNNKKLIFDLIEEEISSIPKIITKTRRIIWILRKSYSDRLFLQPHYQDFLKSGSWSSAKSISSQRIEHGYADYLSTEDLFVSRYYERHFSAELEELLEVLVKMDNIYNSYDLDNNIFFKETNFPITIYDTDDNYKIELPKTDIKKHSLFIENDYLYKIAVLNDSTLKLLKELQKSNILFSKKDKNMLLNWIENNKTLDITATFYFPQNVIPEVVNLSMKIVIDIEFIENNFFCDIRISPSPDWELYNIHKKGLTIIHKDQDNNYFIIKRNKKKEEELLKKIKDILKIETDDCKFKTKSNGKIINILKKSEKMDDLEIRWIKKGKKNKLRTISSDNVNWSIKSSNNWFELDGSINFNDDEKILLSELLSKKEQKSFFVLKSGDIVNLTDELRNNLKKIEKSTINKDDKMIIPPFFASDINEILEIGKILERSNEWKDSLNKFKKLEDKTIEIPQKMNDMLRDYQKTGVKWISKMTNSGFGVCLADDMGLGKTIQAIMAIAMAPEKSIIIAPASVLYNWKLEFEKFAPELNPIVYEGKENNSIFENLNKKTMIIVSYDKFQRDAKLFNKENWGFVVLDEAQMIKNAVTKRAKAIFELKADKRIALSGTPIENHLGELWSLYHFLNPVLLGSKQMFNDFFVKPILNKDDDAKNMLKNMLDPFLLRRLKKDVLKELPDKTEVIRLIDFEGKEKTYYEVLRRKALKEMNRNTDGSGVKRIKILAHLSKLRQAACDISLIGEKIEESAKTKEAISLIEEIIENNHKVLVFSQFTSYLSIMKEQLDKKDIKYLYLDGSTSKKNRQELVDDFQGATQSPKGDLGANVFLISLRAGGTGLNLTAANYVIHLDPWWNPAVEDQATDRTHRIGQLKSVTVYKMIVKNSIEEKIIKLHESKKDLSNSILDNMDEINDKLSIDDLLALL